MEQNKARFIELGTERINLEYVVAYGIREAENGEHELYIALSCDEDEYVFLNDEFNIREKLREIDNMLL